MFVWFSAVMKVAWLPGARPVDPRHIGDVVHVGPGRRRESAARKSATTVGQPTTHLVLSCAHDRTDYSSRIEPDFTRVGHVLVTTLDQQPGLLVTFAYRVSA